MEGWDLAAVEGSVPETVEVETAAVATARVERASVEAVAEARGVAAGDRAGSAVQGARAATVRAKVARTARFHARTRL